MHATAAKPIAEQNSGNQGDIFKNPLVKNPIFETLEHNKIVATLH